LYGHLVGEREATHTGLDAEDVVVGREHVHRQSWEARIRRVKLDRNLRVVDAGEVACASWLVLLWLEREGVRVHTWVWGASVVVEGLDLVEVLTFLFLEAVLAVEDELEGVEGTDHILSEGEVAATGTNLHHGRTHEGGGHEAVGGRDGSLVGGDNDVRGIVAGGEVPKGGGRGGGVGEAPHELLNWVVVGEADLLGLGRIDGVGAGVLDLLDEVLVALLREAATLLGVEVDVVRKDLDRGREVGDHVGREVDVDADLVVLEGDEGEVETGVAVEEEDEGEVDSLARRPGGHLTPGGLLGLIQVKLGVQTPPLLVVLVDTLATDGKLNVVDGTLGNPARRGRIRRRRLEFEVHVTDEITVARNGDGHATGVRGSTVDGLLDVLHREVGVALVFRLEEGHLRVTGKVNILGTVSYELHETTGHFESCCTIGRENNFRGMRKF
jgi:hypothetical protein